MIVRLMFFLILLFSGNNESLGAIDLVFGGENCIINARGRDRDEVGYRAGGIVSYTTGNRTVPLSCPVPQYRMVDSSRFYDSVTIYIRWSNDGGPSGEPSSVSARCGADSRNSYGEDVTDGVANWVFLEPGRANVSSAMSISIKNTFGPLRIFCHLPPQAVIHSYRIIQR
ncbi:MAG: hypothetical protein AB8G05_22600 [Oligoflexales bacterium]